MTAVGLRGDGPGVSFAGLTAQQDDDGCFASWVEHEAGRLVPDRNGFVTALVLRALRGITNRSQSRLLADRAMPWLQSCRSSLLPGAFCFWPESDRPAWARGLPPDADDTAVITAELLRYGALDRALALRTACHVLLPHRVAATDAMTTPRWVRPGAFLTWLTGANPLRPHRPNVVDCCVNGNVLALLAMLDATHLPGYDAAVQTIRDGLDWAGTDPVRLSALTPFYPNPSSLADALTHAVECGAEQLRDAAQLAASVCSTPLTPGCFRSAYGRTTWYAPVLDEARTVAEAALRDERSASCP